MAETIERLLSNIGERIRRGRRVRETLRVARRKVTWEKEKKKEEEEELAIEETLTEEEVKADAQKETPTGDFIPAQKKKENGRSIEKAVLPIQTAEVHVR